MSPKALIISRFEGKNSLPDYSVVAGRSHHLLKDESLCFPLGVGLKPPRQFLRI
jgi:hypothetical protein